MVLRSDLTLAFFLGESNFLRHSAHVELVPRVDVIFLVLCTRTPIGVSCCRPFALCAVPL